MARYDEPGFRGAAPNAPDGYDARSGNNAPGSAGVGTVAKSADLMSVDIAAGDSYQSGQLPRTPVMVEVGSTCSLSDKLQEPPSGDALSGVTQDQIARTGAGDGVAVSASTHGRFPWQQPAK